MDNKELNNALRTSAISKGLCSQWQGEWKQDWDEQKMVARFYKGLDFYLENRFISKELFIEGFGKDFLRKNGILVDDTYSLLNPEKAILIGDSKSTVRYNGRSIAVLNMTDNAEAKVTARGHAFVIIHMLDTASLEAEQFDLARVVVIIHSKGCRTKTSGGVDIKYELDYLM